MPCENRAQRFTVGVPLDARRHIGRHLGAARGDPRRAEREVDQRRHQVHELRPRPPLFLMKYILVLRLRHFYKHQTQIEKRAVNKIVCCFRLSICLVWHAKQGFTQIGMNYHAVLVVPSRHKR